MTRQPNLLQLVSGHHLANYAFAEYLMVLEQ